DPIEALHDDRRLIVEVHEFASGNTQPEVPQRSQTDVLDQSLRAEPRYPRLDDVRGGLQPFCLVPLPSLSSQRNLRLSTTERPVLPGHSPVSLPSAQSLQACGDACIADWHEPPGAFPRQLRFVEELDGSRAVGADLGDQCELTLRRDAEPP